MAAERQLDRFFGERIVARDEVTEDRTFGITDRCIQTRRGTGCGANLQRLLERDVRFLGDFLKRRLAAEHRPERALGAIHLLQTLDDVNGHPNRSSFVGESPGDGLPNPPRCVRGELEPPPPVELLDCANQAQRSLLDQIEERQSLVAVVLRNRDDEPKVGLNHRVLRGQIASLDPLCQRHLLGRRQEGVTTGLAQKQLEGIGRRLGHRRLDWSRETRWQVGDLDPAFVELAHERLVFERREFMVLCDLCEIGRRNCARELACIEEHSHVVLRQQAVNIDRRHGEGLVPRSTLPPRAWRVKPLLRPIGQCTITGVMSS